MRETAHDETTPTDAIRAGRPGGAMRRKLFVMRTGARLFAVYADEVEATSENLTPTPLPSAPPPVRGVVARRGQILTLIDPLPLLPAAPPTTAPPVGAHAHNSNAAQAPVAFVVALKGDEQLALAVESIEREIELYDEAVEAADTPAATNVPATADASGSSLLLRRIIPYGAQWIALLDPARLFDAAMQGVERRRQRT